MTLDWEIDPASGRLLRLESAQPHVAVEASAATGGECCRDPAPRLQAVVGEVLDARFPRTLSACFGGALGCSHLLTLAQAMATTVPGVLEAERARDAAREPGERMASRAIFLDGIDRDAGAMDLAVQMSETRTRPRAGVALPLDRLDEHRELVIETGVDLDAMRLHGLAARERTRSLEALVDAPWHDHGPALAPFEGGSALAGLAGRLFGAFGEEPGQRFLLDGMLQLAPGLIQCLASLSNRLLAQLAGGRAVRGREDLPPELSVGGQPDSCYMWRRDGFLGTDPG